jgi:KaiC/GvpD/RAD55 family RecA-like ATPase
MSNHGYNIFVSGVNGTGKTSMVKAYVERVVRERETREKNIDLEDWCYLYNFREPDEPAIVNLPKGTGCQLRRDMTELLEKIRSGLGQAFSSDEYKEQRQKTIQDVQSEQQKLFRNSPARPDSRDLSFR